jgi:type I restriction enzyme R subunit
MLKEKVLENKLSGTVLIDETFVGGKNKNRHWDKKVKQSQGRSFKDKTPVLGILEQEIAVMEARPHKVIPNKTVVQKTIIKPAKLFCKVSDAIETIAEAAPLAEVNITQTASGIEYHSPSEKLTRELYIDILLKEAGWIVGNADTKTEYKLKHSVNGSDRADYVLFGNDGKALAVVEAKRTEKDGRDKALGQAKRYADALEQEFGTRPIIFATNGFEHYIWDDLNYPYRPVQGFYSKDDLETLINRRIIEKPLVDQAVDVDIAGRYYQIEAIQRAKETLEKGNRDLLFIMATGSGKTRTAAALVDVLTRANKVKRILFLADRNPLVTQAKGNFNDYLPQLTSVNLGKDKNSDQVRMVFSTYQTMINCIDTEIKEDRRLFTCGYFDLVIFDEVHRSIYQKYKAIFNYFDAIRLGLTATPKAETHKDTYELFHLETGVPTFSYELNKAVDDNFLKPPKTLDIPLKFPREGIKYADLSEEDKLKYEETFADSEENIPDEINSSAVNEWLFNESTVNQMIQLLMDHGQKVNNGDTIGKTIIFAKNQSHARFILECFNKMYPHFRGDFMQIVTHSSDKPEEAIDLFKQSNKLPQIVVSVDMLDKRT